MAKIGILIPVYNGAKYLDRCLSSVLAQTFHDLEVLIIDDGSNDSSLEIAKNYAQKHPKLIRVIAQKNMGVARTRNKGIRLLASPYVMFMDQDDWLDIDYCETFLAHIDGTDLDVVSGGYRRPDSAGRIKKTGLPKNTEYGKYVLMAAWAKIHRTEFLREQTIEFFDNKFGEDSVFTVKEIARTKKWKQIDYVGYNWFFNESSVSNTAQKQLTDAHNQSLLRLLKELISVSANNSQSPLFEYYLVRTIVFYLLFSGRRAGRKNFMTTYRLLFDWLSQEFPNFKRNKYLAFGPAGEEFQARVVIAIFVVLHRLRLVNLFAKVYCHD